MLTRSPRQLQTHPYLHQRETACWVKHTDFFLGCNLNALLHGLAPIIHSAIIAKLVMEQEKKAMNEVNFLFVCFLGMIFKALPDCEVFLH